MLVNNTLDPPDPRCKHLVREGSVGKRHAPDGNLDRQAGENVGLRAIAAREENMATTVIGRPLGRRAMLAGIGAALTMPFIARRSRAEAKAFRISTPGPPEEWQSKSLELFKKELDAAMPGQFDVQIHYN